MLEIAEVGLVYHGQFSRCDDPNLHGAPGILLFLFFATWMDLQTKPEEDTHLEKIWVSCWSSTYNYVGLGDEVCRWGSVFALELDRQVTVR